MDYMEREQALKIVKKQMPEHRYQHTLGVKETAIQLALQYQVDEKQAELAAIFHDYAKYRDKQEMKSIIEQQQLGDDLLHFNKELWHAPVGAYLVEKEVGITDPEILDAIRFHTSGRPNMTKLEKIIYLADYIEPGRHFPGVDEVREFARLDLDKALIQAVQNTITFLLKKNQPIFPLTVLTYNNLISKEDE
jgi:predicted HD superfamily hydrolase involved in NAD metabolism